MDKLNEETTGIIGEYYEGEYPIIVKFVNELPTIDIQRQMTSLTIVSWQYDGTSNNGMPLQDVNKKMIMLEEALADAMQITKQYVHAYSRTGNNLKELVYYSVGMDGFMASLNETLKGHERYPIEVDFYNDPEWTEMKTLIEDFKGK